jgi:protoporphyrinogen oxidase
MIPRVSLLILGAGPTGLGAARRWSEMTVQPSLILEGADRPGGLASSYLDHAGFTWDLGSHLQFSHYDYYDQALNSALADDAWNHHQRSTWVWMNERFIPYPFQMNLHHLPPHQTWECIQGLLQRPKSGPPPEHFGDWCHRVFGSAVTELFMRPYNEKLWQCPLEKMGVTWVAERVAAPELHDVLRNLCLKTDAALWGPNATFRYPKSGGTGSIWQAVADQLPGHCLRVGNPVVSIDPHSKTVRTSHGERIGYEFLLSTIPLPSLVQILGSPPELSSVHSLRSTRTHIVGIGLSGQPPEFLTRQCWSYFPQADIPFYRLTVLSNLSRACVPHPDSTWSLMAEIAEPHGERLEADDVVSAVIKALVALQFTSEEAVISRWHRRLDYGYPVPTTDRDEILRDTFDFLDPQQIYSRGRFGAWMYEISNQDHSFMQGVELVNRLTGAGMETTLQSALTTFAIDGDRHHFRGGGHSKRSGTSAVTLPSAGGHQHD